MLLRFMANWLPQDKSGGGRRWLGRKKGVNYYLTALQIMLVPDLLCEGSWHTAGAD